VQEEAGDEVAAGRVAADADAPLGDAELVDEVAVAGEDLALLRRVGVLRGESCAGGESAVLERGSCKIKGAGARGVR